MRVRYKQTEKGLEEVAKVYTAKEHNIDLQKVDKDAIWVVEKLFEAGFESFIVGGAVRDLMLGLTPKDFDIATEALPKQVHKVFRNSRIIGRRFKIVHVVFKNKIIEVSTFRSLKSHDETDDNQFGSVEEDAKRRDFSINSLYYNPLDECVLDFNNAYEDFESKKITSLIPLNRTFIEDPVRMIRAIKAEVLTGFSLPIGLKRAIRRYSTELDRVSSSRLTEELNKILNSGHSEEIFRKLYKYKLLVFILPALSLYAKEDRLYDSLRTLDSLIKEQKEDAKQKRVIDTYFYLFSPFIILPDSELSYQEKKADVLRQVKVLLSPNTPPNILLEVSVVSFLKQNNIKSVKRKKKKKKKKKIVGLENLIRNEAGRDDSSLSTETNGIGDLSNVSEAHTGLEKVETDVKTVVDKVSLKKDEQKIKSRNKVFYEKRKYGIE